MAFESLSDKLNSVFKKLRSRGKLTEADIKEAMREVKLALLEADVNFKVVKEFIKKTTEQAIGEKVLESLTPAQQVIKIVNDELIALMGSENEKIQFNSNRPTVILLSGLQGAGKTTTAAKLGGLLKKSGKRPLLAACDVYRPAAIDQLKVVGESLGLPVYTEPGVQDAVQIAKNALNHAVSNFNDVLIIDTAGRLHIDEQLMQELVEIKAAVHPDEILLVIDAMTGQDAVNVANEFNQQLELDGIIVSKMDGDTRGGCALSVKAVTGKPIKFVGMGEKLTDLEPFHPERMVSRILGMGDVMTLIEKAQDAFDEKKSRELEQKLRSQKFTLADYLDQLDQLKNMGPLSSIASMLPGVNQGMLKNVQIDDRAMARIEAIIKSMTPQERENPGMINSSRKQRIANGSGTRVADVNNLLKQFEQMQKMMKQLTGKQGVKKMKRGKFPFFG